jgi:hypothetical protein
MARVGLPHGGGDTRHRRLTVLMSDERRLSIGQRQLIVRVEIMRRELNSFIGF